VATLADVARHAGVAASTVSYVLSGKRSVSAATRHRVERSIELLDYHPHAGARALASNRSSTIALVVPQHSGRPAPVMMEIAIAVTTAARRLGYDVLLLTSDEGAEGIRRVVVTARADAMILMDVSVDDERIPMLREAGIDAVILGVPSDASGLACVDLDFAAAGDLCVDHLAGLGHREVAFISEAPAVYGRRSGFAERTLHGVMDGAAARSLRVVHRPCEGSHEAAAATITRILEDRPGTTGLIVANEAIISPLLSVLRTAGRIVPEEMSVVAICPDQAAERTSPHLTSVSIPAQDIGRRAVEVLARRLGDGAGREVVLLPPRLTVRGSSAPA
jgi:DNA-binding LacI/PurR family transcriptional regulator